MAGARLPPIEHEAALLAERAALLFCPICRLTKFDPHLFRVVLPSFADALSACARAESREVKELDLVGEMGGAWQSSLIDGELHAGVQLAEQLLSVLAPDGRRSAGIESWWELVPDHVSLFLAKRVVSWQ